MDEQAIKTAKTYVHNRYGSSFAEKASDALCISLTPQLVTTSSFREAAAPQETQDVVMEFSIEDDDTAESFKKTIQRDMETLKNLKETLAKKKVSKEMSIQLSQMLRQAKIKKYREDFYKYIGTVTAHIESNMVRMYALRTESMRNKALTNTCWLNQTVKSPSDPDIIADIASDNKIKLLDLPRTLTAEVNETAGTVFSTQYQKKFRRKGKDIIVAVIDSEVAINHPALEGRVIHRQNYTLEPWGNPDYHGTAVAGIVASKDRKFVGMAPEATVYNYKVLATNDRLNGDDFQGAIAIQQALEDGAHIANCSWGAGLVSDGTSREARACNTAWELGMAIVKSSGNRGPVPGVLTTPADADGIIVVGATDRKGIGVEEYSSRGPLSDGRARPHLVAPGGSPSDGVFSCLTSGGFGPCGNGTSYAAPHVSGLLALILEENPFLSPDEQRDFLLTICSKLGGSDNASQGGGLISMSSLLKEIT